MTLGPTTAALASTARSTRRRTAVSPRTTGPGTKRRKRGSDADGWAVAHARRPTDTAGPPLRTPGA